MARRGRAARRVDHAAAARGAGEGGGRGPARSACAHSPRRLALQDWDGNLSLGALPLPLFMNGHGYFVQASAPAAAEWRKQAVPVVTIRYCEQAAHRSLQAPVPPQRSSRSNNTHHPSPALDPAPLPPLAPQVSPFAVHAACSPDRASCFAA